MLSVRSDNAIGVLKLGDRWEIAAPITFSISSSSFDRCCYHFKVTNRGRRTHQLCWSTEGFPMFSHRDRLRAVSNTKGTDSFQSPKPACPVFKLQPLRTELMPGKTVEMVLEGSSSTPQVSCPTRAAPSPPGHLRWGFFRPLDICLGKRSKRFPETVLMPQVTMAAPAAFLAGHHQCFHSHHKPSSLVPKCWLKGMLLLQKQRAGYRVSCAEAERKGGENKLHLG